MFPQKKKQSLEPAEGSSVSVSPLKTRRMKRVHQSFTVTSSSASPHDQSVENPTAASDAAVSPIKRGRLSVEQGEASTLPVMGLPSAQLYAPSHQLCQKPVRQTETSNVLYSSPSVQSSQQSSVFSQLSAGSTGRQTSKKDKNYPERLDTLNSLLSSVGFSPVSVTHLKSNKSGYVDEVLNKIQELLGCCCGDDFRPLGDVREIRKKAILYNEMICQLKTYFENHSDNKSKMLALSVLPKSLSVSAVQEDFKASKRQIQKIKALVGQKGILCIPEPKQGRRLSDETIKLVKDFFYRMDVSRELPGKKDVLSVMEGGKRTSKRKRLVLGTLSKLHEEFIADNSHASISLAKFAELRPRECVLAGSPGTHNVCVCTYHQNPKMMFQAAELNNIDGLSSPSDCLKYFLCENPSEACHLRTCEACPDGLILQEKIELYMAEEMIENVTFNLWKSTDRSEMETLTCSRADYIFQFMEQMEELVCHSFIAEQQAKFYHEKLNNLEDGEVVVNADFAENYSFIIQDSSQGHYFNNKQATIHPFMCYAKQGEEVIKIPFVVISDHLVHDTTSFSMFQRKLVEHLKEKLGHIKKIYYFSDGSAAQYKNRKCVANTCFHFKDFGIPAEWHFFATSHGKCACDGLGGTVKRTAYLHSLRNRSPDSHVTTPVELFNFCIARISSICFAYASSQEILKHGKDMEVRFQTAAEIRGIKSSHAIIPSEGNYYIIMKSFSNASSGEVRKISTRELELSFSDIRGFVIFKQEASDAWKLGYVNSKDEETEEMEVTVLVKAPQKNRFEFGDQQLKISKQDVLLLVEPQVMRKRNVFKLVAADFKAANEILQRGQPQSASS